MKLRDTFLAITALAGTVTTVRADVIDDILSLPQHFTDLIYGLVICMLYPFARALDIFLGWVDIVYTAVIAIINSLFHMGGILTSTFGSFISTLFPSWIVAPVMTLISIAIGIRLYRFLKGVSIFGWSLG